MAAKVHRYIDEIRHCWRLGAGFSDRASLAINTLRFHLQNATGQPSSQSEAVRQCLIRLRHRPDPPLDFFYRLRGGDLFVLHEVLMDQCYRIPPPVPEPVRSIVDLGSNIGVTTLYFAMQFPEASFVCVEPDPRNIEFLSRNVAWLGERARIVEAAIRDRNGEAEFAVTGFAWQGQLRSGSANSIRVSCYCLETLLERMKLDRVDVLKVDIEGAERDVFGSRGEWWNKVRLIIAELHGGYSFEDFERDVRANGFRAIRPGSAHGNALPLAVHD
jgi:FkbM family methyltransferase